MPMNILYRLSLGLRVGTKLANKVHVTAGSKSRPGHLISRFDMSCAACASALGRVKPIPKVVSLNEL